MVNNGSYLFSSESVAEGHPDKVADQISDAVLDSILAQDPTARVDCETLVMQGSVIVTGQITTTCYVDVPSIVRRTLKEIGLNNAKDGLDWETCGVLTSITEQSPDIAMGVDGVKGRKKKAKDSLFMSRNEGQKQSAKREFYQILVGIGVGIGIIRRLFVRQ